MRIYDSKGNPIDPDSIDLNIDDTTGVYENIKLRMDGMIGNITATEVDDGTIITFYDALGNIKQEITVQGKVSDVIFIRDTEPEGDVDDLEATLWVDTTDLNLDDELAKNSELLSAFENAFNAMTEKVNQFDYAVTHSLDLGYFGVAAEDEEIIEENADEVISGTTGSEDEEDSSDDESEDGEESDEEDLPLWLQGETTEEDPDYTYTFLGTDEPTFINHFQVRRGYKADLATLDPPLFQGEFAFCIDTNELYIGNNGVPKLVGGSESSSSLGNLTGDYVQLESENDESYRVVVDDDGNLHTHHLLAYTSIAPSVTEASIYEGLIIRHVYGGGVKDCGGTVCSHSFIELYNNSTYDKNLNGLCIQYAEYGGTWSVKTLTGIIPPYHCFLIRCAEHTDMKNTSVRFKIKDYDMSWPSCAISDRGFKIYLGIGEDPITNSNPYNINGSGQLESGYIDLFAVGGTTEASNGLISDDFPIDACEFNFVYCVNKYRSAERRCNISASAKANEFADTGKNAIDIRCIDLRTAPVGIFRPRCLKDGRFDSYYDKIQLKNFPMCVNMGYGKVGETTRTFSWQTLTTHKGYIKYKKVGDSTWIMKPSTIKHIGHPDCDATTHNVIITDLTVGNYVYKVGSESLWSDEYEFEVKTPTVNDPIKILWTSDQQGWNEHEYRAWGIMYDAIKEYLTYDYDFMINTGDISQNGGGHAYEWRYYYDFAYDIPTKCHMTTCGNNDLTYNPDTDKKEDPTAYTWYTCIEDTAYTSCYSWNYGYVHFVCLNSNTMSVDSEIALQQVAWLKEDLAKEENQKRWKIVYMHEPVYAQTRSTLLECFITPMAEGGVDLCLGGHHHRYTRSKRMGALGPDGENVESDTGFYSLMINACGYKLSGKTAVASNSSEYMDVYDDAEVPNFAFLNITYDKITFDAYKVYDVVPFTLTAYGDNSSTKVPRIEKFDGLEITK